MLKFLFISFSKKKGLLVCYLNAKELHDPLVVILIGVDGDKEQVALVLLGDGLRHLHLGLQTSNKVIISWTFRIKSTQEILSSCNYEYKLPV